MRSRLKESISIFILVDGLAAVQSPRRIPVKNLTRHSGTGKLSGTTCPGWIGHEVVYFGLLHIRNGSSDMSRTLFKDFSRRSFSLTVYLTYKLPDLLIQSLTWISSLQTSIVWRVSYAFFTVSAWETQLTGNNSTWGCDTRQSGHLSQHRKEQKSHF